MKHTYRRPLIVDLVSNRGFSNLYNKTNRRTNFQIYPGTKLYMFRADPLPIIRSYPLYIRHWHMSHSSDDSLRAGSGWNFSLG